MKKAIHDIIVTSPPYLTASSGREHYASSRALAFSVLGYQAGEEGLLRHRHTGTYGEPA